MKKIILSALVLLMVGTVSQAQTEKGYYLIGGNITNLGGSFQKGSSSFNFSLTPKVAWFIKDNIAVGGQVDLGLTTSKDAGTLFSYNVGPLARYYFGGQAIEEVRKTRFFAEANVGFGGENNSKSGVSTNGFVAGIGPGLAYFLNENIALEALAKFNLKTGFGNSAVAFNPQIGVGFQIHLPSAKLKEMRGDIRK